MKQTCAAQESLESAFAAFITFEITAFILIDRQG